ncbi:hypothetical protein [uncultured Sphingomonas sp.]|uniref:hypothetical protein n=1 Tax=uncultured Sphingomonas sp. TaxID=158754 RepID=UPI002630AAB4|nr:hypothetical protein [uncultured Sphingomonas sp.]
MDQHIAFAIVADQEAETAGRIKPLDVARDFNLARLRERRRFRVCIVGTDYSGAARTVRIRLVMKGSKMRRLETGWSMIGRAHRTQRHASCDAADTVIFERVKAFLHVFQSPCLET